MALLASLWKLKRRNLSRQWLYRAFLVFALGYAVLSFMHLMQDVEMTSSSGSGKSPRASRQDADFMALRGTTQIEGEEEIEQEQESLNPLAAASVSGPGAIISETESSSAPPTSANIPATPAAATTSSSAIADVSQFYRWNERAPVNRTYMPQCPPHPRIQGPTFAYNHIPYTMRTQMQTLCAGKSQIRMYPGATIVLEHVILDFSKRTFAGDHAQYADGFVTVDCAVSSDAFRLEKVTRSVRGVSDLDAESVDIRESDVAVVSSRDDCGNVWHALADHLRIFVAGLVAETSPMDRTVLVLDDRLMVRENPDDTETCLYHGSLDALGRKGVRRGFLYKNQRVYFPKLIIHAEDTRYGLLGLIWGMMACDTNTLLTQYVNNLYNYFHWTPLDQLIHERAEQTHPETIRITFSSRRKKPFAAEGQRIGRVIRNEAEVIDALRLIPNVEVTVIEFFEHTFQQQLQVFRNTDILVGMHGAGLANLVYLPLESAVVELIPFTWRSDEYERLSGVTGRPYFYWRNGVKANHIEPDCPALDQKESTEGPNVCRAGTSETIADVQAVVGVVSAAVREVQAIRKAVLTALDM